jgi:hypothetical protein
MKKLRALRGSVHGAQMQSTAAALLGSDAAGATAMAATPSSSSSALSAGAGAGVGAGAGAGAGSAAAGSGKVREVKRRLSLEGKQLLRRHSGSGAGGDFAGQLDEAHPPPPPVAAPAAEAGIRSQLPAASEARRRSKPMV